MKKILLGVLIGAVLFIPAGAFAWNYSQRATPIKTYNCTTEDPDSCYGVISRFTDGKNTCYVTNAKGAISCVKERP